MAADVLVRPMAVAHCGFCSWKAQCTGDDMAEAVTVLRRILIDHVWVDHPGEDHSGNVQYRSLTLVKP